MSNLFKRFGDLKNVKIADHTGVFVPVVWGERRMNTRKFLIDFLKELESSIPPPPNCHHVITYAQYGSDETGWEDRLAVQINRDGRFVCFFLDTEDFDDDPFKIATTIGADLLNNPDVIQVGPRKTQYGVGPGQYVGDPQ